MKRHAVMTRNVSGVIRKKSRKVNICQKSLFGRVSTRQLLIDSIYMIHLADETVTDGCLSMYLVFFF